MECNTQSPVMQRARRGFTLIELLVVIAIIAILAAILFPVFAQARAKARQTTCLSNVKQLNMGMQMYAQDYDERFPTWAWWASSPFSPGVIAQRKDRFESLWINAIYPYVKNNQIYECPDTSFFNTPWNTEGSLWGWHDLKGEAQLLAAGFPRALLHQNLSYAANEPYLSIDGWGGWPSDGKIGTLDKPAQTLLIADGITAYQCCPYNGRPDRNNPNQINHRAIMRRVAYANGCDGTWWGGDPTVHKPEWENNNCARHNAGENIGFADGHAKWFRSQRITDDLYFADQAGG